MDLGVSSHQLMRKAVVFLIRRCTPDMRMDPTQPFSAMNVVNEYEEKQLAKIILEYAKRDGCQDSQVYSREPTDTYYRRIDGDHQGRYPCKARRGAPPFQENFSGHSD